MKEIFSRRSVRKYQDRQISKELLDKIIRAGMAAPSAGNEQPWEFVIVDEKSVLNEIMEVHPYSSMLKKCSAAVVVCGNLARQKHEGFWVQDCSAATQNMLLEAWFLGIGSVWLGVYPVEERTKNIAEILNLPQDVLPLSIVSLGYPEESPTPQDRYDSKKVHHNTW